MATSYNGWIAAPNWSVRGGQLEPLVVAGEPFSPGVRVGDVRTVLGYVANALHARVEPVVRSDWHQADDWGYSYRPNANNPSQLSCHASGTAIDYNATRHPNGKRGTWTAAQRATIAKIMAEVNGCVRNLSNDEMHFEICKGPAAVATAATKIRGGLSVGGAVAGDGILERGDKGDSVRALQRVLKAWYPREPWSASASFVDGDFGEMTEYGVKHFQTLAGLGVDGVAGPKTLGALGLAGLR